MRFISSVVILCWYRRCLMKLLLSRQTPTQLTVPFDSSVLEGAFAGVNIFLSQCTSEKLLATWTTLIVGSNYKCQLFFCLRLQNFIFVFKVTILVLFLLLLLIFLFLRTRYTQSRFKLLDNSGKKGAEKGETREWPLSPPPSFQTGSLPTRRCLI